MGEAMSCGVPCVTTDARDSGWIVGETGRVVPVSDPAALSNAISVLVDLSSDERGKVGWMARQRIQNCLSLEAVTATMRNFIIRSLRETPLTFKVPHEAISFIAAASLGATT